MNFTNYEETKENKPFIQQRADPYVYRHTNGIYYFTASVPEYNRIILRSAGTLDGLAEASEKTLWKKHDSGIMSQHIWAPELHYIEGSWYIYFAASSVDDIWALRPYVLKCSGNDPMKDEWNELGQMKPADEFTFQDFSLDMTVFENQKKWYAVWAEKISVGKKISNLYIAEMKTPVQLASPQVLLSSPVYNWEREGFWVNEGPSVIKHGGKLFLTYSASSTGSCYCMGMLSADENENLLDPYVWRKSRWPVLKTDKRAGLYGPGHNCFTKGENGEDIMIYHARQYDEIVGDPLYDPNRHTYRMRVEWRENKPIFLFKNNY